MNVNQSCGFTNNLLWCKYWKVDSRWLKKHTNLDFTQLLGTVSLLGGTLDCVRLVINLALAARTQPWYEYQERVGYKQTSAMLTNWKKQEDLDFLTCCKQCNTPARFKTFINCGRMSRKERNIQQLTLLLGTPIRARCPHYMISTIYPVHYLPEICCILDICGN